MSRHPIVGYAGGLIALVTPTLTMIEATARVVGTVAGAVLAVWTLVDYARRKWKK